MSLVRPLFVFQPDDQPPPFGWDWLTMQEGVGVLVLVAALVVVLLIALVPRSDRRAAREPLVVLVFCILFFLLHAVLPQGVKSRLPFELLALFLALCCIGRSAFLLVEKLLVVRWLGRPPSKILMDVLRGVLYVAALLVTLKAADVEPASLFTGSAIVTAAIGLSMRDTLGNLFAGLAIQAQRPFDVGDWIQFDADPRQIARVVEINWRATKLMTQEEVEVIVPNSTLAQAPIRNYTKPEKHSRRSIFVNVPFDIPTRRVHTMLVHAVADAWGVLRHPAPTVVTHAFTDSGVEYWIRFFIDDFPNRDRIDGGVRDRVWYALSRNGVPIPYPHRELQVRKINPDAIARDEAAREAERRDALRGVDFLHVLPDAALAQLAAATERRFYAESEAIIREGDVGNELFIVTTGEVVVTASRGDGQSVELNRMRAPKFFGEMSIMTGQPRHATVTALEDCEVFVIRKADLAPILTASPELAEHISETLARRQLELDQRTTQTSATQPDVGAHRRDLLERIRRFFSL